MHTRLRSAGVHRRGWTKKEYYRLGELGFFHGQRVELIEGQLMVFSPQNALHANTVLRVSSLLQGVFQTGHHVRPQVPLDLGQTTEPEPDIAVVAGTLDQVGQTHLTSAVLIVEVSDTTVSSD